ncbi:TetR/AcrR family transcriptional regulator [Amycolatopsis sp. lyj-346]|uniref:TetR/AcrR family transcriptional regulator n=1 Tax=Amycolatopsis sp. lyj-346 TaxID=2789289 RepID=UPI0039789437
MNSDNQATERLQELRCFLQEKNRRIDALLQLFSQDPTLPIEAMVREYGSVLDSTDGHDHTERVGRDECANGLEYRQRGARTKRVRTRERIISAATELVVQRESFRLQDLAELAKVGVATLRFHFSTKDELLWAVYDRLVQPILNPIGEGN